ncbi:MAG TPA: hypothetical protein VFX21_11555 [Acidimicrobiia bacterium]|nr:hypothetical protein [Acidimicrobiia bacterium]
MLGLEIPNFLPRSVPWPQWDDGLSWGHSHWVQHGGRLIWATVAFVIGLVIIAVLIRRPKSPEPATWAASIGGAFFVWLMMVLAYAIIPHEWIIFANSYLQWGKDKFFLQQDQIATNLPPFSVQRYVLSDMIAAGFYVVFGVLNVYLFSKWQKRPVAEPVAVEDTDETAPADPLTGPFSRLRRRSSRTSAYGRPVTTGD